MGISDNDPARRNLVITALAFILYDLAGGGFTGNQIKLPLINMTFTQPEVLIIAAWTALVWFVLRFYQTREDTFLIMMWKDLHAYKSWIYLSLANYLVKKDIINDEVPIVLYMERRAKPSAIYIHYKTPSRNARKDITEFYWIWLLTFLGYLSVAFTKSGFSNHAVPYILFWLAVGLNVDVTPVKEWLMQIDVKTS